MLERFFAANRRLSQAITPRHIDEANVFGAFRKIGALLLSRPDVRTVVDVGAGKHWHFPRHYKRWYGIHLIGLDINAAAMAPNDALDEKIECDVSAGIPLPDDSADLFMVHSGIEHFPDNQKFLEDALRILRPGGCLVAQFPSRYAPFVMANRLLPTRISGRVLDKTMGERAKVLGFRAHYDRTDYAAFRRMFTAVGFEELYHLPGYNSSAYCEFFIPLFALSYMYDALTFTLGIPQLASYNFWVLRKPAAEAETEPLRLYAWMR
ncbi:class I SAM-dependent methyltransferase [Povalibacter sp.]|uniref:class I SAM-dependent methyltransferase n=1 Tax=Povalibacter sp. TaxID=1962978 RepID=UPI002F4266AD